MDTALPQGFPLNEYRIESTLGIGGFGVTYLATDANLNLKVAIKEYLPGDVALRAADHSVRSKSPEGAETFNWGRRRFLDESRTLASFRHPNIVRVMRFFEANGTAYMVMEFVAGQPFDQWIRQRRPVAEETLLAIVQPLLAGLEVVHRAGYLHRDIKPENIYIRADESPVLLDFGSARMAGGSKDLTTIVSLGFAPFEQYHTRGGEGPWTDLYAFGAVLYWAITGERPVEAPGRAFDDPMVPAMKAGDTSRYSHQFLRAIDWALAPAKEARPQSVKQWRNVLPLAPHQRPVEQLDTIVLPQTSAPTERVGAAPSGPRPSSGAQPSSGPQPPSAALSPSGPLHDPEALARLAAELAEHIGPIAERIVRSEAKKSHSFTELTRKLAQELPDEKARATFVRKHAQDDKVPSAHVSAPRAPGGTNPPSSPGGLTEAALEKAEAELAKYIGAVARVLVKRAAAKARTEAELYHLLAEHIEDADDRKSFARKGLSISGRRV
ncbi:MAG TPA: serine/threonine-protein kinase [Burkholderiales bacterium]|nr:serine/threonine-protein kinase [Burkholderiales bacterium]